MDEALYALLTGNAPITARVAGRIYWGIAAQGIKNIVGFYGYSGIEQKLKHRAAYTGEA